MDDRLNEMLSRYLDDDLSGIERTEFEQLLETDSQLRFELDGERKLQETVASIASGMEPPVELDRVMEPLRQAAPATQRRVRPVYRWLGAAAAVVLGVTVTLEMTRRNPSPTKVSSMQNATVASDEREIFELAPLPTAVPNDNRPVGATDRLLEEEPPLPAAPEPPALEVVGPLTTDEFAVANGDRPATGVNDPVTEDGGVDSLDGLTPESEATLRRAEMPPPSLTVGRARGTDAERRDLDMATPSSSAAGVGSSGKSGPPAGEGHQRAIQRPTTILVDKLTVWRGTTGSCEVGRWRIVLDVQRGVIVAVGPIVAADGSRTAGICEPTDLIGSPVTGVPDGEMTAEVVVHPPQ